MLKQTVFGLALLMGSVVIAQAQKPTDAQIGTHQAEGRQDKQNAKDQPGQAANGSTNRKEGQNEKGENKQATGSDKDKERAKAKREEPDEKGAEQRERRTKRKEAQRENRGNPTEEQNENLAEPKGSDKSKERAKTKSEEPDKNRAEQRERHTKRKEAQREKRGSPTEKNENLAEPKGRESVDRQGRAEQRHEGSSGPDRNLTQDSEQAVGKPSGDVVKLDDRQRGRVREQFRRERKGRKHYTNVNIEINVGRRLPSDWEYYTVPMFLIDIAPQYRGCHYVWIDDRYVIVEPDTFEVLAYIDADSGRVYATSYGTDACTKVGFSADERRHILNRLDRGIRLELGPVHVGFDVPSRYELHRFPQPIVSDFSELGVCRYIWLDDNRIAVIAPESRQVVAVITN